MNVNMKAKTIAGRLLRANRGTRKIKARSWRVIIKQDFPGDIIKPGTLSRFAISKGEWVPKDEQIQIALGLKRAKKPRTNHQPTPLIDMTVDALRFAFENRQPIEPTYNKRVMDAFIRACKTSSALRRSTTS